MSDTKKDMSDLFRSLRADSPSTPAASNGAVTTAEQRWPILKSFQPKKLAVTTLITDDEKQVRRSTNSATVKVSQTSAVANNVNQQLARGLSRMIVQKQVIAPDEKTSFSPVSGIFRTRDEARPQAKEVESSLPLSDDSLRAVLLRLEQAHQPAPVASPKRPAFLSRLGKR